MDFWSLADDIVKKENTSYSWIAQNMPCAESTISMQRKRGTEPKFSFVVRFCRLLGVPLEYFAGESGPPVVPEGLNELLVEMKKLDPDDLETVKGLVAVLLANKQKKRITSEEERVESAS